MKREMLSAVLLALSAGCTLPPADTPPPQGIRVVNPQQALHPASLTRTRRQKIPAWERRKALLVKDLRTGEPVKRAHAAFWLGELGTNAQDTVPVLVENLGHRNIWVRRASARALGKIGSPAAVKPLIAALRDQNKWVRNSATIALRKIGTPEAKRAVRGLSVDG